MALDDEDEMLYRLSDPSVMIDEAKLINRTIVSEMARRKGRK